MGSIVSPRISGIILAGGLSRRMGRDKAWLPWREQTLLAHVAETLRPLVEEVLVVARPGQALPPTPARVVRDRIEGAGPLGGLEAGLAAIGTPYAVVVACDMPWLNPVLLAQMAQLAKGYDLVIPRWLGRYQPLHAIYAKSLQPTVLELLKGKERRLFLLASLAKARIVNGSFLRAFEPLGCSLRTLNSHKAYEEALAGENGWIGGSF